MHEIGEDDFSRLNILQLEDIDSAARLLMAPAIGGWLLLIFTFYAYHE